MRDPMQELFRVALGLSEPWVISRIEFSAEQHQLDLWVDFPSGSRFAGPECGHAGGGAYDSSERTWRHLNFFEHKTFLHARPPRIECPEHGVKTAAVPWSRPGSGFTLLLEAFILVLVQGGMTPAQAARLIDEHDTRLWRVLQHYVEQARAAADFSKVKAIGVGAWRRAASGPMQVVSGPIGRERVHFESPHARRLEREMRQFLQWFNGTGEIDPVLKAGIAHFWFVTLHPFDDGNGRIARAIADMALARADGRSDRFYSLSSQIALERKDYDKQLEFAQRGDLDITEWLA